MPKPLSTRKRSAVLADIKAARANGTSVRQIARDHGVSPSSVTKIAAEYGIADAFGRSQTENATRAREVDCKALRAQLKVDLLHDAQRLRGRAWSPYTVVVSTPEGAERVTLDEPPLPDVRAAYTAIGIAVDKSAALERHDSDDSGMSAVDAWLRGMLGEIGG
jgi:transposase-like protein